MSSIPVSVVVSSALATPQWTHAPRITKMTSHRTGLLSLREMILLCCVDIFYLEEEIFKEG